MSLFNFKKKSKKAEKKLLEDKIISALNLVPVGYTHTAKFISDGEHPIEDAEKQIEKMPAADYLCCRMMDKYIDEDSTKEKEHGNQQFINNMQTVRQIIDSAETYSQQAETELSVLLEDRARLAEERERFIKLYNSL